MGYVLIYELDINQALLFYIKYAIIILGTYKNKILGGTYIDRYKRCCGFIRWRVGKGFEWGLIYLIYPEHQNIPAYMMESYSPRVQNAIRDAIGYGILPY